MEPHSLPRPESSLGAELDPLPNRGPAFAILVIGIALGIVLALVFQAYILPKPAAPPPSRTPTPVLVSATFNFSGALLTPSWFFQGCTAQWGVPQQPWECTVQVTPNHADASATIVGISTSLPGARVEGIDPPLPLNCSAGTWLSITMWVLLPPNGPTTLQLPIDFQTS
jgi:hypothetical protein